MKNYIVAAYCQNNIPKKDLAKWYKRYTVEANNEQEAEDKVDKKYLKDMGSKPDTVECLGITD